MDGKKEFDFWYAVNNTRVILLPSSHLETFGNTNLNYHLITELMDATNQVRVRNGRLQASRPQLITPAAYAKTVLEGFSDKAREYVDWLKRHERDLRILEYGYSLKQESIKQHIVADKLEVVIESVTQQVKASTDPLAAVIVGVEEPWDVCLVKLFWEVIQRSVQTNILEMNKKRLFDDLNGVPRGIRQNIEEAFEATALNPKLIGNLSQLLKENGLFEQYQDRFFSLYRQLNQ